MVKIGNFFFRYRNALFIFLYLLLFLPSPPLFGASKFGENHWYWPLVVGLVVTVAGQLMRGLTIGLAYIIRGGSNRRVYAEQLVVEGMFHHCRNPLYVGNILMLLGVGILSNSLVYVLIIIPCFIWIYQAIVLAEEDFLFRKFGDQFKAYCSKVNRWVPSFTGMSETFKSMSFNWKRWLIKEYNTQFIWLSGITLILLFKYPQLTEYDSRKRNIYLICIIAVLLLYYLSIRYLKKTGRWKG